MNLQRFPIRHREAWKNRTVRGRFIQRIRRKRRTLFKRPASTVLRYRETPAIKRVMDLVISGFALICLSPLMGLIALMIWLQDRKPVLYKSTRIGKDGIPFEFLKFRTMIRGAEALQESLNDKNVHGDGITFKVKGDPRITPFGKFLRRFSLDELPQLWNVFRGEMSLVGPRPPVPREVARYNYYDMERLMVLPGLTCIWQISGRCEIPFDKQVEMDRTYIRNQSLGLDLWILLRTIPAVFWGKGAY